MKDLRDGEGKETQEESRSFRSAEKKKRQRGTDKEKKIMNERGGESYLSRRTVGSRIVQGISP